MTDARVRLRVLADVGDRSMDGLQPARSPIAIDATIQIARIERISSRRERGADRWLNAVGRAAQEREPVVEVRVVDEARIGRAVRRHVAGALPEDDASSSCSARRGRRMPLVMSADLIIIGDQSGCSCLSSAAMPATCGADIDVPL